MLQLNPIQVLVIQYPSSTTPDDLLAHQIAAAITTPIPPSMLLTVTTWLLISNKASSQLHMLLPSVIGRKPEVTFYALPRTCMATGHRTLQEFLAASTERVIRYPVF